MKSHHTKNKGDIGVLKIAADLAEKSYTILLPQTEHAPFDLAVYKDGEFKRVSCKYRKARGGKFEVALKSSWADKHGNHITPLNKDTIDVLAIYCPNTNCVYYLDPKDFGKSVTLRIDDKGHNNMHKASDYLDY